MTWNRCRYISGNDFVHPRLKAYLTAILTVVFWACCLGLCAAADEAPDAATDFGGTFFERFTFGLEVVSVFQSSVKNNHNYKRVQGYPTRHDRTKLQTIADVSVAARLWEGGIACFSYELVEGSGLDRQAGGLTGVNDNAKAYDNKFAEFWLEQSLFNERLIVTLGKLDPLAYFDSNAVANDERSQFLSNQFVNSLSIDAPDYGYGVRIGFLAFEWLNLNVGVFEDGHKWANIAKDRFSIAEVAFMPQFLGREGSYRLHVWHNSSDHERLKNPLKNNQSGSGYGISLHQYFTDNACVFARWGTQSSDIYEVEQSWSLGFSVTGDPWKRPGDVFGLAYGRAGLSDDYRDQLRDDDIRTSDEGRMEVYYSFYINEYFAITPDIQVVHNLTGARKANTVTIFGLRLHCKL